MTWRVCAALLLVCGFAPSTVSSQTTALVGAWQRYLDLDKSGNPTQPPTTPAFVIFTADGYFSQIAIPPGRPYNERPLSEMSREELVARFDRVVARRGSYNIAGNRLTRHNIENSATNLEGTDEVTLFRIDGDKLIYTNLQWPKWETFYRRRHGTATTNKIVGAWQQITEPSDGRGGDVDTPIFLFFSAEGFFSQSAIPRQRPRVEKPTSEMSRQELLDTLGGITAFYGTFAINGDQLTLRNQGHVDRAQEHDLSTYRIQLGGDVLALVAAGDNHPRRFRRVKQTP